MISEMFSQDYDSVRGKRLSFYGNDPVCMFKAFVHSDDPQVLFVWAYLSFHFLCFVCVAICHGLIAILVRRSHIQSTRTSDNSLNCNVSLICLTDFCCWMPFLFCCVLHTAEVVDMSPWYQIFSLNILPLNSVLNPVLYSGVVTTIWNHFKSAQNPDVARDVAPNIAPEDAPEDAPVSNDTHEDDADVPDLDVPDLDVPDLDVPNLHVPDLDVPDLHVPDLDVPDLDVPDLDVPLDILLDVPAGDTPDISDIPPELQAEDAPEDFPDLPLDVPSAEYAADVAPDDTPEKYII
eukprot:sb/3467592/